MASCSSDLDPCASYEKRAGNYRATVVIASLLIWMKDELRLDGGVPLMVEKWAGVAPCGHLRRRL